MGMMNKKNIILICAILLISIFVNVQAETIKLDKYATDITSTISQQELDKINSFLANYDKQTSTQVVFLMIPALYGYPIEMKSHEIATANNIGTKEHSNGVLFLVAKDEKKMRIEVGYGLEGALPDATCSSIIRNEVAPHFRKGDYANGVVAGLNSIIAATRGEYVASNPPEDDNGERKFNWFWLIFLLVFFFLPRLGRRRVGSGIYYTGGLGGGFRGGSFGGGGGFGGFSGGGGSFGGGGASGSW